MHKAAQPRYLTKKTSSSESKQCLRCTDQICAGKRLKVELEDASPTVLNDVLEDERGH